MPYKNPDEKRRYAREWMARRRAAFLEGKACVVCGSTVQLEVDHVDQDQKLTHRVWSWSAARREAELAKCQVLCKDHHQAKTLLDRKPTAHGRAGMYWHGCRCDECKAWNNARVRKQRM